MKYSQMPNMGSEHIAHVNHNYYHFVKSYIRHLTKATKLISLSWTSAKRSIKCHTDAY